MVFCHNAGSAVKPTPGTPLPLIPVGARYTVTGEIKSVITVVAKTTHYREEHLSPEVKQALATLERLERLRGRLTGWLRRPWPGA